jgi:CubicO group peptidase (beta-lactamase class C family)
MNRQFALLRLALTLLICSSSCQLAAQEDELVPVSLDELKTAISKVLEENEVPGVGVAMVDKNGPVWIGALGKANLELDIPADEETMFRIGSTSKMFVALSVLKLVEEGRLSLDDRVSELVPELEFENQWEATDPVRVVHLLEHTTGWDDIHLPEYAHNDPTPATLKQGLDFHPHSRISRWVPGTRMSYCNSGPPVAAYIVEKITGQDFEDYVAEHFFRPMGMETMTYRLSEDFKIHGATLYDNGNTPQDYWHIVMRPAGSINASAMDMARFVGFYINRGAVNGQQLISPASLERMETVKSTSGARAGQESGYGLHNYTSSHEQWVYHSHEGGVNGGLTELAYLPEAGLGHAFMTNSGDYTAFAEISRLIRAYETRDLKQVTISSEHVLSDAGKSIEGYYYPISPRQQVGFFLERVSDISKLWIDGDRLARKGLFDDEVDYFLPVSDSLFKSEKTGVVSLARTEDPLAGDVVHINMRVFKPASVLLVFGQFGVALVWGILIITAVLFFPVWLVRRLRKKIAPGAAIRIRTWPLLAGVSALSFVGLFMIGMNDPFKHLGTPNVVSIGIMFSTILLAVFALLGVATSFKERHTPMNRFMYWHSSLVSVFHLLVTAYLLAYGVIGLMTWA